MENTPTPDLKHPMSEKAEQALKAMQRGVEKALKENAELAKKQDREAKKKAS